MGNLKSKLDSREYSGTPEVIAQLNSLFIGFGISWNVFTSLWMLLDFCIREFGFYFYACYQLSYL